MEIATYDALRHLADSWGLVYMFAVFIGIALFLLRPGARHHAAAAAAIPLRDDNPVREDKTP